MARRTADQRKLFLEAHGRPYRYLDTRIRATMGRMKQQETTLGEVEWERLMARQSAGHFEDFVR